MYVVSWENSYLSPIISNYINKYSLKTILLDYSLCACYIYHNYDDQNTRFSIFHMSSSIRSREILERNGITQDKSVESNRTIC